MSAAQPRKAPRREDQLADTFVALTDTLTAEFDLADVHGRLVRACVDVLSAAAAGLVLADAGGRLGVVAASTETTAALESLEVQREEGPCHDCYRTARPVPETDLAGTDARWPRFTPAARAAGYTTVRALPLRLRGRVLGALNLYGDATTAVAADDVPIAQALADVATIALLQQRAVVDGQLLAEQLQTALTGRVVVEQAKGMLAERGGTGVDDAFAALRSWARGRRRPIAEVARELVDGRLDADVVLGDARPR